MDVPGDQLLHENVGRRLHDSALVSHIETSNKMLLRSFKLFAANSQIQDELKENVTCVGKRKRDTDDLEECSLKKRFVKTLNILDSTQDLLRNIYKTMNTPETIILSSNGMSKCYDINEILNEINEGSIVFLHKDTSTNNELLLQNTKSPIHNTIYLHQDFVNKIIPITGVNIIDCKDQKIVQGNDNLIQPKVSNSVSISQDIDIEILSTITVDVIDHKDQQIITTCNHDELIQPKINESKVTNTNPSSQYLDKNISPATAVEVIDQKNQETVMNKKKKKLIRPIIKQSIVPNLVSSSHVREIENKISQTNAVEVVDQKNQKNGTIKNNNKLIQSKTKPSKMLNINPLSQNIDKQISPSIEVDEISGKNQKIVAIKNHKYRNTNRYKNSSVSAKNRNYYPKNKDVLQNKSFKTHRTSTKKSNYYHKRRIDNERR